MPFHYACESRDGIGGLDVTPPAQTGGNGASAPSHATSPSHPIYKLKADFFRTLGHPVRVRILELLREGERTVGDLQAALELDSGGTSQHLSALRKQGLVDSRREGTSVYYRIKDPRTLQLLEVARQILSSSLEETKALLVALAPASNTNSASGRRR
jgi:DNA-binding transcriptional ArsR family regulator